MKETNIQNDFLDRLKTEQRSMSVITINGYHIDGQILGHDRYTILMNADGQQQLVYKHAISTIKEG